MIDIEQLIQACFNNARDLLRAAKRVLTDEQLPNIAFHLAILAVEEIGKGTLIGTRGIGLTLGDEAVFIDNRVEDHIFKLFWALWTPSFARGRVEQKEFEGLRGLARSMHDERLAAMYVSPDTTETGVPLQKVTTDRAQKIIDLAEARLDMERSRDWKALDLGAGSVTRWFFEAANDPQKRNLIFGEKSFEKLAELGLIRDWMNWLKEQFDRSEAEGRAHLQRELARIVPEGEDLGEPKWQVVIRLYSPGQSTRNHAIKSWNDRPTWIKLSTINKDKLALDVEFTYHEAMPARELGPSSYRAARLFVAAMNLGTLGFWWWQRPGQSARCYQRLKDLKAPTGMKLDFNLYAGAKFEWKQEALTENHLNRVALCLGMASRLENPAYNAIVEPYMTGLALIAKSDLHLNLAPSACERFAACLLAAMGHFGDWDGTDEGLLAAIGKSFRGLFKQIDDEQELLALLRQLRRRPPESTDLTLEPAAILKVLCDGYLIKRFEKMAEQELAQECVH
jgi:AbiV family abortive infection protein